MQIDCTTYNVIRVFAFLIMWNMPTELVRQSFLLALRCIKSKKLDMLFLFILRFYLKNDAYFYFYLDFTFKKSLVFTFT